MVMESLSMSGRLLPLTVGGLPRLNLGAVRWIALFVVSLFASIPAGLSQTAPSWAAAREGEYVAKAFHFRDGSVLPELRLHYRVLGQIHRDSKGHVDNAVLILHGTGGAGANFLSPQFAGVL